MGLPGGRLQRFARFPQCGQYCFLVDSFQPTQAPAMAIGQLAVMAPNPPAMPKKLPRKNPMAAHTMISFALELENRLGANPLPHCGQ